MFVDILIVHLVNIYEIFCCLTLINNCAKFMQTLEFDIPKLTDSGQCQFQSIFTFRH